MRFYGRPDGRRLGVNENRKPVRMRLIAGLYFTRNFVTTEAL